MLRSIFSPYQLPRHLASGCGFCLSSKHRRDSPCFMGNRGLQEPEQPLDPAHQWVSIGTPGTPAPGASLWRPAPCQDLALHWNLTPGFTFPPSPTQPKAVTHLVGNVTLGGGRTPLPTSAISRCPRGAAPRPTAWALPPSSRSKAGFCLA